MNLSDEFFSSVIEHLPNMVFIKDAKELRFVRMNRAGEELLGLGREQLIGKNDYDFFPKEQAEFFIAKDRAVLDSRKLLDIPEEPIETAHGRRYLHTKKIPLIGPDGRAEYLVGISEDITETRQKALERLRFLAEAGAALGKSLEEAEIVGALERIFVPALADSCAVDLSATGQAELRNDGGGSELHVPIRSRGEAFGLLRLRRPLSRPRYDESDLALATEICGRAATAIENARLYGQAQKAVRARDEFLSIASHELKTPLTSLKLQLQMTERLLAQAQVLRDERLAQSFAMQNRQLERLSVLVEELLDVARIDSGRAVYQPESTDVAKLVRDVLERFEHQAGSVGVVVTLEAPENLIMTVDRFRLDQVILNLMTNALKYGAGKPIRVSLAKRGDVALLSVNDQGIGIAPDMLRRIFERFVRAIAPSHITGLGLGLYIVREIVRCHGGRCWAESELGRGSTFYVELPLG